MTGGPSPPAGSVSATFPDGAEGALLTLHVHELSLDDARRIGPCTFHRFDGAAVYMEGCAEVLEVIERDLIFLEVSLTNAGETAVRFDVERFLLGFGRGDVLDPVDVRAIFDDAPFLLPPHGLISPDSSRSAYLTFDGRIGAAVARSLNYVDRDGTITVAFEGRHSVARG